MNSLTRPTSAANTTFLLATPIDSTLPHAHVLSAPAHNLTQYYKDRQQAHAVAQLEAAQMMQMQRTQGMCSREL